MTMFIGWVINQDVTAARMLVPVRGHRTNTMNVHVVSLICISCSKGLSLVLVVFFALRCVALSCHRVPSRRARDVFLIF